MPEDDFVINGATAKTDEEKCIALFTQMEVQELCQNMLKEIFRLGKKDEENLEKCRPLKIRFTSSTPATAILGAGEKLKNIPNQKIYAKPDKTKGEQEEFKRLGKRKEELLREYENDENRVKLKKGGSLCGRSRGRSIQVHSKPFLNGGVENVYKNLNVCFWNINGRKHLIKSQNIQTWLDKNFDIVFLSETHLFKGERYKLNSFTEFHNSYSVQDDRKARGGISCFIKSSFLPFVSEVQKDLTGHILIHLTNGNKVFGSYIAPLDSPYCDPTEFSHVANAFVPTDDRHIVFGGGDLNGRVGDMPKELPLVNGSYRYNCDRTTNDHGREILNVCRCFSCFPVNNLDTRQKHFDGDFTFRKSIVLANGPALSAIRSFTIHREGWNPSDHAPVSVNFPMSFTKKNS